MKFMIKCTSILLALTILLTTLASCGLFSQTTIESQESNRDELVSEIVSELLESIESSTTEKENQTIIAQEENEATLVDFAYDLLVSQLETGYNVFAGVVQDSDGEYICGLAYYDYSDCYIDSQNEEQIYIMCGFIPDMGEKAISAEDFNSGMLIKNAEYTNSNIHFVWKYKSDALADHCVVNQQYLTFGVDENGYSFYELAEYSRDTCDTSLGSLYSYDEMKYLYDPNVGNYCVITGESLSIPVDYSQLEAEVNDIIANQNENFSSVDIESALHISYEAVYNTLASLSEETFMGYKASDLFEVAKELDPNTCIELSPTGILLTHIAEPPPESATALTKWLVGSACVIVIVASMAASALPYPGMSALTGATTAVAMDVFMQVVFCGRALGSVNWKSVAISAVSGAISGMINPMLQSALGSGIKHFFADTAIDATLAGLEVAALGYMEGERGTSLIQSFGEGFVMGAVCSAGLKLLAKGLKVVAQKGLAKGKIILEHSPKLSKIASTFKESVSEVSDKLKNTIGKKIDDLRKVTNAENLDVIRVKVSGGRTKAIKLSQALDACSNENAQLGAKQLFEKIGFDWDKIQSLKSNKTALKEYFNSIPFKGKSNLVSTADQLLALADEKYLPNASNRFSQFLPNAPQTTGDSAEWYLTLNLISQGFEPQKEVVMDLAQYKGYTHKLFDYEVTLNKANRKSDVVYQMGDLNVHIESKVGRVYGKKGVENFAHEIVADLKRIEIDPNTRQQYRIYSNANNNKHMLQDPKQAKLLLAALQEQPEKISIYLDDVLLSMDDLLKYVNP